MAVAFPLEIFYDGSCAVCSAEMQVYRRRNPQNRLRFTDISTADFEPEHYGKSLNEFMAMMHVREANGKFATGVEAFMLIWQAFPDGSLYRLCSALIGLPGINLLSRCGYSLFARYRYLLPKKAGDCESGTCHIKPGR